MASGCSGTRRWRGSMLLPYPSKQVLVDRLQLTWGR